MGDRPARGRLDRLALRAAATLGLAGVAAIALGLGVGLGSGGGAVALPQPASIQAPAAALAAPGPYSAASSAVDPLDRAEPVHLRVSRVGIDTGVIPLGLNADRTMQTPPPTTDDPAGWYRNLASPGEIGPAVIVGHLDTATEPGVFFNLGAMRPGDTVEVARSDGSIAVFSVDSVARFAQADFPTVAVYGATDAPSLRLITCAGQFSEVDGYADSLIVFASLTDTAFVPGATGPRERSARWLENTATA